MLSPLTLNQVSVRSISCTLQSVMMVLISVLFLGLLTEWTLNRVIEIWLARAGMICREMVIRLLKFMAEDKKCALKSVLFKEVEKAFKGVMTLIGPCCFLRFLTTMARVLAW